MVHRSSPDGSTQVRPILASDIPAFLELVQALADYEKLRGPDPEARERLARDALADPPPFSVLLAERGSRAIGYAAYFFTYSTFLALPTLFVEDIFVLPDARRGGAATALMRALAQEAVRRGCGRMEWQVLTWNQPAMDFYGRLGARQVDDWLTYRLLPGDIQSLIQQQG